ncbi:MAG: hypothetical protein KAT32_02255 [Candidatus Moranbacteria bacterium]|nr:hypothetical protein [Candidatus Moranbacteria bacterium]
MKYEDIKDISRNKLPHFGIKIKYTDENSESVLTVLPGLFYNKKVFKILQSKIKNDENSK